MNLQDLLNCKDIFKITGTPENFLTALRYNVWGFNNSNIQKYNQLKQGEIVFFHCKAKDSYFINKITPCVIGFGIVGNNFHIDSTPLWIDEFEKGLNYPYRFSFSEIYLFSDIPLNDDWDSTSYKKKEATIGIIKKLLENGIPLNTLEGFPVMGSFSSILENNVKNKLFDNNRALSFFLGTNETDDVSKPTELISISTPEETLRYSTTLSTISEINKKVIKAASGNYKKDYKSLSNAEEHHFNILSFLINYFKQKDFTIYYNTHIDLFVHNKTNSILFEAKSIENNNFKKQSRTAIAQLFEYNYFEVANFKRKNEMTFKNEFKVLVTSKEPSDFEYTAFINSLNIKTAAVHENKLINYGSSLNFNDL